MISNHMTRILFNIEAIIQQLRAIRKIKVNFSDCSLPTYKVFKTNFSDFLWLTICYDRNMTYFQQMQVPCFSLREILFSKELVSEPKTASLI